MDSELLEKFLEAGKVETDTRKNVEGAMFFALKGENFNGNAYALSALDKGALYAIVDEDLNTDDPRIIRVENGLESLQSLARNYRDHLNVPTLALTGSNGKTTTKELISLVLQKKYKCHATKGNFNNHIGVPLTILSCPKDAEMLILEMGASAVGEISELCHIGNPTHGVITNIGEAHLEGFGSIEGVKKGKSELYRFLKKKNGTVFVNMNEDYLDDLSQGNNRVLYGDDLLDLENCFSGELIESIPHIKAKFSYAGHGKIATTLLVDSILSGNYNYQNILTAAAIGAYFNVKHDAIKEAISSYVPSNNRSQTMTLGSNTIILDAYNANPSSMMKAIKNCLNLPTKNKILILGSMKELGAFSEDAHKQLIKFISGKLDVVEAAYFVGEEYESTEDSDQISFVKDVAELKTLLKLPELKNKLLFIKGSRSNKLEQFICDDKKQS